MINNSDVILNQCLSLSQVVATSFNILYNSFMHELSFDDAFNHVKSCSYYDTPSLIPRLNSNELFLLHINIRSLQKSFDDLVNLISQIAVLPDIICITETRLKSNPFINISIPGYDFVKANTSSFAGGVGMYVSSKLNSQVIAENTLNANCEDIWVCVKNIKTSKKILVASIYRHSSSDTALFVESLNNKIADLDILNYNAYVLGDFNINISKNKRSFDAQNYLDMLASNSMCPIITQPTRVANTSSTIIDHIITNCTSHSVLPGIIKSDFTVHYPVFGSINHPIKIKSFNKYFYRFMKNFNSETFVSDLSYNLDHFDFSTPFSDIRELSAAFHKFIEIIKSTINAHAPLKIASRKQRKLLSKPWLTKGIQISIRNKKKLHQSFYVGGNAKQKLYYKKYANKLTKVKKISKKLQFF